jgi:chromosome segregation ATPase
VFPELATARTKAVELGHELTDVKKELSKREHSLIAPVAGAEKTQLDALEAERGSLESQVAQLPGKAAAIAERQAKARSVFNDLDKKASELSVEVTGLKQQIDASRKWYEDEARKTKADPLGPTAGPVEQPAPPAPASAYAQRAKEIEGRLAELRKKTDAAKQRMDRLKGQLLDKPLQQKSEIEGASADIEALRLGLDGVRHDILEAATNIGVDDADMQQANALRGQYEDVLKRHHALGVQVKSRLGGNERTKADQIESILERARGVEGKITAFNGRVDGMLDTRLKDITSALADEKAHVVAYKEKLAGYMGESSDVGGSIVADNFKGVAQRFYNVVVRSDVGIIDVAWALKDASTKESNRLVAERKRELKLLDDEFKEVLKEGP